MSGDTGDRAVLARIIRRAGQRVNAFGLPHAEREAEWRATGAVHVIQAVRFLALAFPFLAMGALGPDVTSAASIILASSVSVVPHTRHQSWA